MPCATLHLTNTDYNDRCCAIEQGSDYTILDLYVEDEDGEDYTTYTPKGQIRDNYPDNGGVVLAEFEFLPIVYGVFTLPTVPSITGNFFKVSPRLSAAVTQLIPSPSKTRATVDDPVKVGRNVWVYDIELHLGGKVPPKIAMGWVEVTREVTRLS
jgi:hypothetical protein